jgi:hypothetical protein
MTNFDASTPEITPEAVDELLRYEANHLGGGVVHFPSVAPVPPDLLHWIDQREEAATTTRWTYETDADGNTYALNEDRNQFQLYDVGESPVRVHDLEGGETLQLFEDTLYKCALRYIHIFPLVLGTLWWRCRGHFLKYGTGYYMGVHNDNNTTYRVSQGERTIPHSQVAARQTIALVVTLNEGYTGGTFRFPYLDIELTTKTGDILIFPANFMGSHEVTPVLEGDRYSYLEFYSQGSSHPEIGIDVSEPENLNAWYPPHWLNNIFDDYAKVSARD